MTKQTTTGSVYKSKQEEYDLAIESEEDVISKTEILTLAELRTRLKFSKHKDHNGDVVCDAPSLGRRLTAEIIKSPNAYAESKQQCSDRFPPGTKENVADHEAIRHEIRKRKHADDSTGRLCAKNFLSMMSSCGSTRCHTSNWRGDSPPPEENTLVPITSTKRFSLPTTDFNSFDQVLQPLKWPVTAKRGRKGKAVTNPKSEEDPLIDAANNLLLLANGISPGSTPFGKQQNINSAPYDSRVMNNGDDLKINTQLDSMNVNSTTMEVEKTQGSNQNINKLVICYNKTRETLSHQTAAINKPTNKIDDVELVTDSASDQKQYLCSICDKSFSSYQALGGHTMSHNKSKSHSKVRIIKEATLAQAEGSIGEGGFRMEVSEHRCSICSLTFLTGQALGGHKRKHWPGLENSITSSSETARNARHPRVDIDLNKPPPDLA
ncbi:putative zinc finger protein ZAT9-like [Cocos nucifera]|nr:putative zinc finger protein ZAT9-like [Cocos nucifera]